MRLSGWWRGVLIGSIGISAMAGAAQAPLPTALGSLQPGQWQFRDLDTKASRAMCIGDPRALIQFGHPEAGCSRFVIEDTATTTTVRYTCPGAGYGRTTITVETSELARVRTQGFLGGAPFDSEYEARRAGTCGAN